MYSSMYEFVVIVLHWKKRKPIFSITLRKHWSHQRVYLFSSKRNKVYTTLFRYLSACRPKYAKKCGIWRWWTRNDKELHWTKEDIYINWACIRWEERAGKDTPLVGALKSFNRTSSIQCLRELSIQRLPSWYPTNQGEPVASDFALRARPLWFLIRRL